MTTSLNLDGRGVIVVGAGGGGIGTAIARELAAAGAVVTAVDRDPDALALTEQAVAEVDGACLPRVADAADPEQIRALIESSAAHEAPLKGLVNVVGGLPIDRWQPLIDYSEETLDTLLESNLKIALRSSRAFARKLSEIGSSGSIVQIATIAALQAMPFGAGYAASKAALLSLSRTMALEWGALGIRVNAVSPGTIQVPRNEGSGETDRDRAVIPLGRRGHPKDIAGAVLFLLSDLASWITGQMLAVDGGASIRPGYLDETGLPVFVRNPELRRRLLED
jgi:NAD(P)-dependent dehydrogenase (short-subunit alcohol dehydrogenase family)